MRSILVFAVLILPFALCSPAAAQPSGDSVILLKSGQLLVGYVIKSESKYRIQLSNGAALFAELDEIELHCQTKAEAFSHLQDKADIFDRQQQVDLLRWCIRNDLLNEANYQFEIVKRMKLDADTTKQLGQEIELALRQSGGGAAKYFLAT